MMVELWLASFVGVVVCLGRCWGWWWGVVRAFLLKKRLQRVVEMVRQKDYCNGAGKAVQEQAIRARPDGEVESGVAGGVGRVRAETCEFIEST